MKLKMYLRGLGMGIIGTVLILGLSGIHKEELSDDEIKARALQLGMVDSKALVLSEVDQLPPEEEETAQETSTAEEETEAEETEAEETAAAEETIAMQESTADDIEKLVEETNAVTAETSANQHPEGEEPLKTEDILQPENDGEKIAVLQVRAGSGSESICKQLEELGLVEDAKAFDQYLCDQGYARYLRIGTYEIPMGSTEEEIAKMLTGR